MTNSARCKTCGATYAPVAVFDADEGEHLPPSAYCSIHCEHYDGLVRASQRQEA